MNFLNRKVNRVKTSNPTLQFLKSKRSEGFLGMSFSMIFSIILIVFFIVIGFIGINAFLKWQETAQIGMFMQDLELKINEAWNCGEACSFWFNYSLPTKIEAVCFVNMTAPTRNAEDFEETAYKYFYQRYHTPKDNFFIYAPEKNLELTNRNLLHLDLREHNPICFKNINGKISIKIQKKADNPLGFVGD